MKKKDKSYYQFIFISIVFLYFIYKVTFNMVAAHYLNINSIEVIGQIINETEGNGNNRVSQKGGGTYLYEFNVNGKKYCGNSFENDIRIGQAVYVEYVPFFPYFNRISKKNH